MLRRIPALLLAVCVLAAVPGCASRSADTNWPKSPQQIYGDLYRAVEMRAIFPDSKTFADAVPKRPVKDILTAYKAGDYSDNAALRRFVLANFDVPGVQPAPKPGLTQSGPRLGLLQHIAALWPHLTRPPLKPKPGSSALALPYPYVVPGGRFRELYYWDSYFTMLGLKADGREDLIDSMIGDFVSLIERYGHVPNGTRTYYLHRSQPPLLYRMMGLSDVTDPDVLKRRLAALRTEHRWWMSGSHVVTMPDGAILNRYAGGTDTPRDESYREDVLTARHSERPPGAVYRDLRAGAESGWDFSSRWFADGRHLTTIDTMDVVPVDLNSLLYGMERTIASQCQLLDDAACAKHYTAIADKRRAAIEHWLWDDELGRYGDWDIVKREIRPGVTAATAYPLFTGVASRAHADRVARIIRHDLLAPGGLRTTRVDTGQQWDKPNGWPPLQWIAVEGLRRTGHTLLAQIIAHRFLHTVERTYQNTGKLVEKYDVERAKPGGGGEYPLQDGFGWTNGVTRALIAQYGEARY
ncbi:alpha,alpha-trehalase TreA [Stakelama sediminis]|uniref:Alpha,alpha-trehalase n=1 Tax=Stakelama sediminis TaxID=463200 RepID=A0A840YZC3_9SPHN|nr:alpha,alpha-trehalase TreF [Stakelama sediminis]MBB5719161.1 alpha,alpha-trehalase [Stakelama sediminis]